MIFEKFSLIYLFFFLSFLFRFKSMEILSLLLSVIQRRKVVVVRMRMGMIVMNVNRDILSR